MCFTRLEMKPSPCAIVHPFVKMNSTWCSFKRGCQTKALHSAEAEVQSTSWAVSSTQTEPQHQATEQLFQQNHDKPEPPGLQEFLQRVEDVVIQQLVRNARSHAFDEFHVNWEDHSNLVSRTNYSYKNRGCSDVHIFWTPFLDTDSAFYDILVCRFHASIAFNIPARQREVFM